MKFNFFTKNSIVCMAEGSLHKTFLALSVVALSLVTVACGSGGGGGGGKNNNNKDPFDGLKAGKSCYDKYGHYGEGYASVLGSPNYVDVDNICFGVPLNNELLIVIPNHTGNDITDCEITITGKNGGQSTAPVTISNILTSGSETGYATTNPAGDTSAKEIIDGQYGYIYLNSGMHPEVNDALLVMAMCTDSTGMPHMGARHWLPPASSADDNLAVIKFTN